MEGVREIAIAYYERADEEEKDMVEDFFRTLDVNGDGKISLNELKQSIDSWISNENIFNKLDVNGDGMLDFYEVLPLYYMVRKVNMLVCSGCYGLLMGPYFSCLLCLGRSPDTFDLCCTCYRGGQIEHEHESKYLLDHFSLLGVMRDRAVDVRKSKGKGEMDELREIAKSHYRAGSPEVQSLAYDFFRSMDTDGDGKVDLQEFLSFMRQEGYIQMRNPYFFNDLDQDGNGTLDFLEVMTLYYIIKSGRPFCDSCGKFIPGTYFSCVECFNNHGSSFDMCLVCYQSIKSSHNHNGRSQFLDNYTLLEATRDSALAGATGVNQSEQWTTSTSAIVPLAQNYVGTIWPTSTTYVVHPPYYSNAIVPASNDNNNIDKWKNALKAFEMALSIGSISGTMCTIL